MKGNLLFYLIKVSFFALCICTKPSTSKLVKVTNIRNNVLWNNKQREYKQSGDFRPLGNCCDMRDDYNANFYFNDAQVDGEEEQNQEENLEIKKGFIKTMKNRKGNNGGTAYKTEGKGKHIKSTEYHGDNHNWSVKRLFKVKAGSAFRQNQQSDMKIKRGFKSIKNRNDSKARLPYQDKRELVRHQDKDLVVSSRYPRCPRSIVPLLVCNKDVSCKDKCIQPRQLVYEKQITCYCDVNCEMFHDCCADYEQFCGQNSLPGNNSNKNTSNFFSGGLYKNSSLERSIVTENNKNLWMHYTGNVMKQSNGVWMIGSCPKSWPKDDIFYQCRNLSDANKITIDNYNYLPVYTSNGTVYHNRFCAQCNGEFLQDMNSYILSIQCDVTAPVNLNPHQKISFLFKYCGKDNILWKVPDGAPRRYALCIESNCRQQTHPDYRDCNKGPVRVVHLGIRLYKNIHCAKCIMGTSFDSLKVKCGPSNNFVCTIQSGLPQQFSIIFNFDPGSSAVSEKVEENCPPKMVYDYYLETCRQTLSEPPKLSEVNRYKISLWLQIISNCLRCVLYSPNINKEIARNLETSPDQVTESSFSSLMIPIFGGNPELHFELIMKQNESRATKHMLDKIVNFTSPFNITIANETLTVFKATIRKLSCMNLETYYRDEYTVLDTSTVRIEYTGEILKLKEYYPNNTSAINSSAIFVCREQHQSNQTCLGNWVLMKKAEYHLLHNRSLFVNASKRLYDMSEYIWRNRSLYICENFTDFKYILKASVSIKNDGILSILTLVCMSISIIGLVFVLVTYSLFTGLRTPPGINTMNLSVSILLAQLLWLVGSGRTDNPMACTAIAVLLHYFFLVSFVWTSIIAFDTWRAFTVKGRRSLTDSKRKRLKHNLRYMAVGWLSVMVYVAICVVIDFTKVYRIGYQSSKACWMSNSSAILYFFAVPIAVILVFNMCMYSLTLKAINATTTQASVATDHTNRKQTFCIYVRIASVMGFTWIIGFIAPFGWEFLWYPFVILNCLQGLYIALAFGLNQRARSLYRGLITGSNAMPQGNAASSINMTSTKTRLSSNAETPSKSVTSSSTTMTSSETLNSFNIMVSSSIMTSTTCLTSSDVLMSSSAAMSSNHVKSLILVDHELSDNQNSTFPCVTKPFKLETKF